MIQTARIDHSPMTAEQFVATYLSNADAAYRSRAAVALGKLRTQDAIDALNRASVASNLRADVRAAAKRALEDAGIP
jgi:HEAT repeat protein